MNMKIHENLFVNTNEILSQRQNAHEPTIR